MKISGSRILVLGGAGLVGTAVCRELLTRKPARITIHSRRTEKAENARTELLHDAGSTQLEPASGDVFGLVDGGGVRDRLRAHLGSLKETPPERFVLHRLISEASPEIVVDCINTATAIAYRNVFEPANQVLQQLEEESLRPQDVETLLDSLYIPRLTRHVQLMYQSMVGAGTQVYVKVGTTGTGGMGLNIPYTHSEEKPSRMLLSKSAVAGAHSMLLFLMGRTPDAPTTKEIKPAAAIGWKRIAHGPIERHGRRILRVEASPQPLGATFSTDDPSAARERDESLEAAYIDTGENGLYGLEEFAAITSAEQMEFVTPEEIARYLVLEIEGGNTGRDVINALDSAVLGPSYRAGLMRHSALEQMREMERKHGSYSVAFEMLGPPRITKLLYEAHLFRLAWRRLSDAATVPPAKASTQLNQLVRESPEIANDVAAVGIPILLETGEVIRGPRVLVPADAVDAEVTAEKLEAWVHNGWVDLRESNCRIWLERFRRILDETTDTETDETGSRRLRNRRYWLGQDEIQPGKIIGWILDVEERGMRMKR